VSSYDKYVIFIIACDKFMVIRYIGIFDIRI
jgi:hypothetical protein